MVFRPAHAALAACVLLVSAATLAADESNLSLRDAIERARTVRPELAAFAFESRIQDAATRAAGLRPAPTVEIVVEDVLGSGTRSGFDTAQTTLSLSQLFELGGKRDGRLAVAQAQHARLRSDHAARQLDTVADIARSFVECLAQQEREAAAEAALLLGRHVQKAVDERVRVAAAPPAEAARAAVAAAEAELSLEDARHVAATLRFRVATAIGLDRPDFSRVAGDLLSQDPAPDFEQLMARLESAPDFLRFANEERLRQAELRLAQSQRRADLRTTLGVRRYEQGDEIALVGGVSLPLFSPTRAQPGISTAEAGQSLVEHQRRAALLKARAQLFAHYQEMEHARHVVATLGTRILPELEGTLKQTEDAWRRGRYSLLEWSDLQRRLLEARARRIDAAAEFQLNRIEIERLTGESMVAAGESS
ncbi:MAG: TolC family protein [Sinimarinibacterium sp.]|jgi:cobalt-zinc-cadmium efflux system outer membrane protein